MNDLSVTAELVEELRKIFDDMEFISGILVYVATRDDREELLNFIRYGENVNIKTVTFVALDLYEAHGDE